MKVTKRFLLALLLALPLLVPFLFRPIRVRVLARIGNADAMYELGDAYSTSGGKGLLLRPDPEQAYYWLGKAAEKGHTGAMWEMVLFDFHPQYGYSYVQKWLPRAAEAGHLQGMIELSKAYQYGMYGFPQNQKLAKQWSDKVKSIPHRW